MKLNQKFVVNGFFEHKRHATVFAGYGVLWLPKRYRKKGAFKGPDGAPLVIKKIRHFRNRRAVVATKPLGGYRYDSFYDLRTGLLLGIERSAPKSFSTPLLLLDPPPLGTRF